MHGVLVKHGHHHQCCVCVLQCEWLVELPGRIVCVCVLCRFHGCHVFVVVAWDSQILGAEHVHIIVLRTSWPQGGRHASAVIFDSYIMPSLQGLQQLYRSNLVVISTRMLYCLLRFCGYNQ